MYQIENIAGADLIFSPFKDIETASLGIFLRIGSRYEKKTTKGIAHFLEHMLFKGSKNYSCRKIKQEIEGRGGSLNAFTSQEITGYYAHFLNKNLEATLDILLDMVLLPLFKVDDISKERRVILEEIKMYNDLPASRANAIFDKLLWQDHPLGEEVIGYNSTVERIKRPDLQAFKNKYYNSSNMVISFSGDYPRKKIINLLVNKFKKAKEKISLRSSAPSVCRGLSIGCEKKTLEQTHLCLGFRSISYLDSRRLVAKLIHIVLGANMSSRLFEELREKRSLCYDISTEVRTYRDSGAFLVHTGLDKSRLETAILTILKELRKIKDKEVPNKELSRAKDYLLGQIAMTLERPQGRMFYMADSYVNLGKIDNFKTIKEKINSITPADVRSLAGEIFKFKNMCISCVGNIDNTMDENIKKLIKRGGYHS